MTIFSLIIQNHKPREGIKATKLVSQVYLIGEMMEDASVRVDLTNYEKVWPWLVKGYTRCLYIDPTCVVMNSVDELWRKEELSATRHPAIVRRIT